MKVIVTGAAGLIGSNLVKALNERGITDVLAVDNLTKGDKFLNLVDCEISDYLDKTDFLARIERGEFGKFDAIFHEGACSDRMVFQVILVEIISFFWKNPKTGIRQQFVETGKGFYEVNPQLVTVKYLDPRNSAGFELCFCCFMEFGSSHYTIIEHETDLI